MFVAFSLVRLYVTENTHLAATTLLIEQYPLFSVALFISVVDAVLPCSSVPNTLK